jgi:hypothetical protein
LAAAPATKTNARARARTLEARTVRRTVMAPPEDGLAVAR